MKWTSQPTQRDQEIYQAVAISLRPQREVAKLFGVTQGRVSQICKQLRQWLAVQIHSAASPAEDNFIAAHELRLRLEDRLRLASEVFAESRDPEVTIKHRLTQQEGKPDVTVDESITRGARVNHQMFREIGRLDEQHYQACLRESQFKAELVAGESQSRWWRGEALVQRCLGLCRQVVMMYPAAVEQGLTLAPLPQFELTSLLENLRQKVSQGELGEDLAAYLPAEWAVVARQLGLVGEAEEEFVATKTADTTNNVNTDVVVNSDGQPVEYEATTSTVDPELQSIDQVVNHANHVNNADHPAPVSTHLSPRDAAGQPARARLFTDHDLSRSVPPEPARSRAAAPSSDITTERDEYFGEGHHSESDEYRPEQLAAA